MVDSAEDPFELVGPVVPGLVEDCSHDSMVRWRFGAWRATPELAGLARTLLPVADAEVAVEDASIISATGELSVVVRRGRTRLTLVASGTAGLTATPKGTARAEM